MVARALLLVRGLLEVMVAILYLALLPRPVVVEAAAVLQVLPMEEQGALVAVPGCLPAQELVGRVHLGKVMQGVLLR
jgi:hypothetical protein